MIRCASVFINGRVNDCKLTVRQLHNHQHLTAIIAGSPHNECFDYFLCFHLLLLFDYHSYFAGTGQKSFPVRSPTHIHSANVCSSKDNCNLFMPNSHNHLSFYRNRVSRIGAIVNILLLFRASARLHNVSLYFDSILYNHMFNFSVERIQKFYTKLSRKISKRRQNTKNTDALWQTAIKTPAFYNSQQRLLIKPVKIPDKRLGRPVSPVLRHHVRLDHILGNFPAEIWLDQLLP